MKRSIMTKLLTLALMFIIIFCAGCNKKPGPDNPISTQPTPKMKDNKYLITIAGKSFEAKELEPTKKEDIKTPNGKTEKILIYGNVELAVMIKGDNITLNGITVSAENYMAMTIGISQNPAEINYVDKVTFTAKGYKTAEFNYIPVAKENRDGKETFVVYLPDIKLEKE